MIIVFGSINADLVFPVATLPAPGQTLLAAAMLSQPGGKGANQAVAAARDGAPEDIRVRMLGAVGADALADIALAILRTEPIDRAGVRTVSAPTGCASICTDASGRNQIVVAPGANLLARHDDVPLAPGDIVVTQMETDPAATAALIGRARRAGARTIHNHAPAANLDPAALAAVDIVVVNEDEAAWLEANALVGASTTLIRTLGAAGVEWQGPKGRGRLPGHPIVPVDTTAAGDCFVGVLAAALHRGLDLPDAIARANRAAAIACLASGSQQSLPTRTRIDAGP